jgi:hypothetical protein
MSSNCTRARATLSASTEVSASLGKSARAVITRCVSESARKRHVDWVKRRLMGDQELVRVHLGAREKPIKYDLIQIKDPLAPVNDDWLQSPNYPFRAPRRGAERSANGARGDERKRGRRHECPHLSHALMRGLTGLAATTSGNRRPYAHTRRPYQKSRAEPRRRTPNRRNLRSGGLRPVMSGTHASQQP